MLNCSVLRIPHHLYKKRRVNATVETRGTAIRVDDSEPFESGGKSTAIDGLYRCSNTAALTTPTHPAVQDCSRLRIRPRLRPGPEMRRRIRVADSIRRRRRSTSPATRCHRSPRRAPLPRCPPRPLRTRGTRLCRAHTLRHTRYARRRAAAKS